MRFCLLAIVLWMPCAVYAQAIVPGGDVSDSAPVDSHPILPTDTAWAGKLVIAIAGLFLAATVIGPMVRTETEEELPFTGDRSTPLQVRQR